MTIERRTSRDTHNWSVRRGQMIDTKLLKREVIFEYTWGSIGDPIGTKPDEYLTFARQDLSDGTSARHLINSVSNSKRALHLRMEILYEAFGGNVAVGKPKNFPSLIEFLRNCGIASPHILNRINKLRNAVEHDYLIPTLEEVETFLDVTELFLHATNALIGRQPDKVEFESDSVRDKSGLLILQKISFDWNNAEISLWFSKNDENRHSASVRHVLNFEAPEYFELVRFAVRHSHE